MKRKGASFNLICKQFGCSQFWKPDPLLNWKSFWNIPISLYEHLLNLVKQYSIGMLSCFFVTDKMESCKQWQLFNPGTEVLSWELLSKVLDTKSRALESAGTKVTRQPIVTRPCNQRNRSLTKIQKYAVKKLIVWLLPRELSPLRLFTYQRNVSCWYIKIR